MYIPIFIYLFCAVIYQRIKPVLAVGALRCGSSRSSGYALRLDNLLGVVLERPLFIGVRVLLGVYRNRRVRSDQGEGELIMDAMSIAQVANPFIRTVFIVVMGSGSTSSSGTFAVRSRRGSRQAPPEEGL